MKAFFLTVLSMLVTAMSATAALAASNVQFERCQVECIEEREGSESKAYSCELLGKNSKGSSTILNRYIEPRLVYEEGGGGYEWVFERGLMNEETCAALKAEVVLKMEEKLSEGTCLEIDREIKERFRFNNTKVWLAEGYEFVACGKIRKKR